MRKVNDKVIVLLGFFVVLHTCFASTEYPLIVSDESVTAPVRLKKVEATIPESLKGKVIKGGVIVLEVVITPKGHVTDVKVLRSLQTLLDQAAVTAVRQWKYRPALKKGKPVARHWMTSITFPRDFKDD